MVEASHLNVTIMFICRTVHSNQNEVDEYNEYARSACKHEETTKAHNLRTINALFL